MSRYHAIASEAAARLAVLERSVLRTLDETRDAFISLGAITGDVLEPLSSEHADAAVSEFAADNS